MCSKRPWQLPAHHPLCGRQLPAKPLGWFQSREMSPMNSFPRFPRRLISARFFQHRTAATFLPFHQPQPPRPGSQPWRWEGERFSLSAPSQCWGSWTLLTLAIQILFRVLITSPQPVAHTQPCHSAWFLYCSLPGVCRFLH